MFLPGSVGDAAFWHPVGGELPATWGRRHLSWPGLGDQPHDPAVGGYADLTARVLDALSGPSDLVAQSMGGMIAIQVALRRPDLVRRLVLCATSGGIDVAGLGAADWRAEYRVEFPHAASWVCAPGGPDHTRELHLITVPTLLLWGDQDPLSPLAVGRHLEARLPDARLHVIPAAAHGFGSDLPAVVAPLIVAHLDQPG